jgi:hypothetical protein
MKGVIVRKRRTWALAVLVATLVLSGCGGPTSSLLGDASSNLGGQGTALPLLFSGVTGGLPALPLADWKPFASKNLQVTINHPPDWSVKEQANGISFTSPEGTLIQLLLVGKGDLSSNGLVYDNDLPDTRCSSATNTHGVTIRLCLDALAESRTANFILKPPDGPARIFSLLTGSRGNVQVFDAMIASIRPLAL